MRHPFLRGLRGFRALFLFVRGKTGKKEREQMGNIGNIEVRRKLSPASPPSPAAEPIFKSAHAALKFATNFSHGTLKPSFLALVAGGGGNGRGLGGLDGAAQAGMVLAELMNLDQPWRSVIIARFTASSTPCACRTPCCRGARENADWGEAIDYLTEYVLHAGLTGTISHYRLRRSLVTRYFGHRESFIAMAESCGLHRRTAGEYNKAVVEHFRRQEKGAMGDIEGRLITAGIVES